MGTELTVEYIGLLACTSVELRSCVKLLSPISCPLSPLSILKGVGTCGGVLAAREPFRSEHHRQTKWHKVHTQESCELADDLAFIKTLKDLNPALLCWQIAVLPADEQCAVAFGVAHLGDGRACFAAALFNHIGLVSFISRSESCSSEQLAQFVMTLTHFNNLQCVNMVNDNTIQNLMRTACYDTGTLVDAIATAIPCEHQDLKALVVLMTEEATDRLIDNWGPFVLDTSGEQLQKTVNALDFEGAKTAGQLVVWDRDWAAATDGVLKTAETVKKQLLQSFLVETELPATVSRQEMQQHLAALNNRHVTLGDRLLSIHKLLSAHPMQQRRPYWQITESKHLSGSMLTLQAALQTRLHDSVQCRAYFEKWVADQKGDFELKKAVCRKEYLCEIASLSAASSREVCSAVSEDLDPIEMMMNLLKHQSMNLIDFPVLEWIQFANHDVKQLVDGYIRQIEHEMSWVEQRCNCRWDCECWYERGNSSAGWDYFEEWAQRKLCRSRIKGLVDSSVRGALCYLATLVSPLFSGFWLDEHHPRDNDGGMTECWGNDNASKFSEAMQIATECAIEKWVVQSNVFECKWWILCLSHQAPWSGDCAYTAVWLHGT